MYCKNLIRVFILLFAYWPCCAQVSVTTLHNDLTRSGWNNKEQVLTPANVNVRQFGKIFSVAVDDQVYTQPLILSNVMIGNNLKNVAVVGTVNNTVYAFDADNGTLFWSKNYTPPGLRVVYTADFLGPCDGGENTDISKNVGIIGTPVIDSVTATLYFVTRCTDAVTPGVGNFFTYLHAVDITNGNERTNSPTLIQGSVPGNSSDAVNGLVPFNSQHQNQRLALALYNGIVFIGFSSQCDWVPYHGWIFGYDAASLQRKLIYNTTPKGMGGGIWQSGGGIAIDNDGYMYIVSGNAEDSGIGVSGNPSDLINRAQSSVKLQITDTALVPVDFFTPYDFRDLDGTADLDYGSTASFLIPGTKLFFTGCKDGNIYVLNTDNLGGINVTGNQIVQTIPIGQEIPLRCHPAYYASDKHEYVYIWSQLSQLKALPFNRANKNFDLDKIQTLYNTVSPWSANISTSSNAYQDGTGIVWVSQPDSFAGSKNKIVQVLKALDANDVSIELWNSKQNLQRDSSGYFMKFAVPTIANGKVYLANSSGHINAYGIIDSVPLSPGCTGSRILSTKKNTFASSFSDSSHSPAKAVDLISPTNWRSNASGVQWIGVDLGNHDSICNISLQWTPDFSGKDFYLQVSDDSSNWTTVNAFTGNTYNANSVSINASGRYVRVYCTSANTANGYYLQELTVYGSVIEDCQTPQGVVATMIDTNAVVIRWNAVSDASTYNLNFKPQSSSLWQIYSTTADSFFVNGLSCNTYYQYTVASKCGADTSGLSPVGDFNTKACENCLLPTRTFQADIGNVGVPGQGCFAQPEVYYINGGGADIGNNADAFHFVYKDFSGDGNIKARIITLDKVNPFNKAGVMIRERLSADSRFVFLGMTSSHTVVFLNRQVAGGSTVSISQAMPSASNFKIVKKGNTYSAYTADDKTNWTLLGTMQNQMLTDALYAGMAVTSHDSLQLSNAKFKGVSITSTAISCSKVPKGIKSTVIGTVSLAGNVCYYTYNRFVINGSGTTVGDKADSFFYVYQQFAGNKTITVKVTEQDESNALNKAGIMIRFNTKPTSQNVYLGLTSDNGAVFQYRADHNKKSYYTYTGTYKAPYYLRLVKHEDSVYTGYISADGISWQKTGEVIIKPGRVTKFLAGMAVTSNDASLLSRAVFDGWTIEDSTGNNVNKSFGFNASAAMLNTAIITGPELKAYPNPANKNFWIDFDIVQKQNAVLSIIGLGTGRIFFKENLMSFSGHYHKQFTEARLPKGSYLITLKCKEFSRVVVLIVQ